MSPSTIYLVSGANRGLGLALVSHILATHDSAFVYAGVRDPGTASALIEIEKKHSGRLSIVKCVSANIDGNKALAKEVEKRHGRVDTVIANAGIANSHGTVAEVSLHDLKEHFNVNVFGTIVLFQSVYDLLKKSSNPRFVSISAIGAFFDGTMVRSSLCVCYAASKAALNWATRKIHFENEWLVAFPMSPGAVETDMLTNYMKEDQTGLFNKLVPQSIPTADEAASRLIKIIDESTRAKEGGEFIDVDGSKLPW